MLGGPEFPSLGEGRKAPKKLLSETGLYYRRRGGSNDLARGLKSKVKPNK